MASEIIVKFMPAATWSQRAKWELLQDYTSINGSITVPEGFITDGASIPRLARNFFSPTGRYFGAAIIHDYILITEKDWIKANREFEAELTGLGITSSRKTFLMAGVKTYAMFLKAIGKTSLATEDDRTSLK